MLIKDYLYLETDDACALCGQRGKDNLTEHHIDGNPRNNDYDNRIVICYNCHQQYNQKKGITKSAIEERKRRLIKKTLTQPGVNAIKMAARDSKGKVIVHPSLLYHLVDLGFMQGPKEPLPDGGISIVDPFVVTDAGKRLYNKWLKDY